MAFLINYPAIAVLALFCGPSSAHLLLANPTPYGSDIITNSPLSSSGSNFPCQVSGSASTFYSKEGISNTATAGESITMSFKGSAVHGGGSCQVALSTDLQPSQSTRWSVILSIEGGCPTKDGSGPSTYDVKIPADIPAGDYSYAWTWTSKESGTQEYYMNCAPLTIKSSSSSSKRRSVSALARRDSVMSSYPPLAVYNMADLNSCKSELSSSPLYPYPGSTVERLAASSPAFAKISGSGCFAKGVSWSGPSSGSGSTDSSSSSSSSNSDSSSTSALIASGKGIDSTISAAAAEGAPSTLLVAVVAALASAVVVVVGTT